MSEEELIQRHEDLMEKLRDILRDEPPSIQGSCIGDLLGTWLSCHRLDEVPMLIDGIAQLGMQLQARYRTASGYVVAKPR